MSVSLFLFISFICAFIILYLSLKESIISLLRKRRESIISDTVSLKKDLKFVELDREKSYKEYLIDKDKSEDWEEEAKSAYLSCYNQKKTAFDSFMNDELNKIKLMKKNIEKDHKILVVESVIESLSHKAKDGALDLNIDFCELIKNL